ncbi:MAG: sensor histidine kinase [Lachnospiraceae bacterium]
MKKLSITAKITIWYTIFLVVISTFLTIVVMQVQASRERAAAERAVVELITDVMEQVTESGDDILFSKSIKFYQKETYISIYDTAGELIVGRRPASIGEFPDLTEKTFITIKDDNGTGWYVYDRLFRPEDQDLWIRGMMKQAGNRGIGSFLIRFLLICMPGLLLLAALGGWLITRRAFRPVRDIIHTTNEIRAEADMSKRIPLGSNHDELYELTASINGMFDSIEGLLSREKRFSSDVSHELRTPIAVIQSQSEYALEDPRYAEKALKTINQTARQMSNLVNKLLLLSRSDAGTLRLEKEVLDFSSLLSAITDQQQMAAAEDDIEITADIEPGILVTVDEDMLIRVILNLVSNAIQYGRTPVPEGSSPVSPAGRIHITLINNQKGFAECTVADSGCGIPEAEQEKVWDRFYQIDGSRSSRGKDHSSAGLGLSMVQALTKAMGGSVSLESREGQGASFTIRLPITKEPHPGRV